MIESIEDDVINTGVILNAGRPFGTLFVYDEGFLDVDCNRER